MQTMTQKTTVLSPLVLRLLTASCLVSALVALLLMTPPWCFGVFLIFCLMIAYYEFLKLHPQAYKNLLFQTIFATNLFTSIILSSRTNGTHILFLVLMTVTSFVTDTYNFSEKKSLRQRIEVISHGSFGALYLFTPFYFILKLLDTPDYQFWFFTAVLATALGDTFAYFGGRAFGKTKLAPTISPNKTREGAYVALLGGALGSVVMHQIYQRPEALWQQILLGVALAILGILGDLAESAIKRAFDVKDSGNILPGHGGVLDRIDAYLFTLPAVYFYAQWIAK